MDFKAGMLDAIPGYTRQAATLNTLRDWLAGAIGDAQFTPDPASFASGLALQLAEAASSDKKPTPPELTATVAEYQHRTTTTGAIIAAHRAAVETAERQLRDIHTDGLPHAFDYLRKQLAELRAEWTALEFVPGPAEVAIRNGRGDEYQRLHLLAEKYVALRAAHRQLLAVDAEAESVERSAINAPFVLCGQMREHLDAEPYWQRYRRQSATKATGNSDPMRRHKAWLSSAPAPTGERTTITPGQLVPTGYGLAEWVDNVFSHDPWIGSASDLLGVYDLARQACSPGLQRIGGNSATLEQYRDSLQEEYQHGTEHGREPFIGALEAHRSVMAKLH